MVDKVDISSLKLLHFGRLKAKEADSNSIKEQKYADRFKGSDLFYDSEEGTLKELISEAKEFPYNLKTKRISFEKLSVSVQLIRTADSNGDGYLDLPEAKSLLVREFPDGDPAKIAPKKFLEGLQRMMKLRFNPIANNIKRIDAKGSSQPVILLLREYNQGLFQDDARHANAVLPYNGLTKSLTNGVLFLPAAAYNLFAPDEDEIPYFLATRWALNEAKNRFEKANEAIDRLQKVFEEGIEKNQAWALSGDLNEALSHLNGEDREIIVDQLAGQKIYSILAIDDPQEKFKKLAEFAEEERPGFLGIGGGNTSDASFWNYTGDKRNIYFAKSIYHYLSKKSKNGNPSQNETLQLEARNKLDEIKGDEGGFANLFWVGVTNVLNVVTFGNFEPTPYRAWGDLDSMNGLGRAASGVLALWGGHHGLKGVGEAWNLRRVHGTGELLRVWGNSLRRNPFKIIPRRAFAQAAAGERSIARELSRLDRGINKTSDLLSWPFRIIKKPFSWAFSKLAWGAGKVSPAVESGMGKMAGAINTGSNKLVHGVLLLGILNYTDEALSAPLSPFEGEYKQDTGPDHPAPSSPYAMGFKRDAKRTLNINRPKRLQDFDPLTYPTGSSQTPP